MMWIQALFFFFFLSVVSWQRPLLSGCSCRLFIVSKAVQSDTLTSRISPFITNGYTLGLAKKALLFEGALNESAQRANRTVESI